jgi:hypothetical protein
MAACLDGKQTQRIGCLLFGARLLFRSGNSQRSQGQASAAWIFPEAACSKSGLGWTQLEAIPMEDGFLNKWHAKIPGGPKIVELIKKKSDEKD